MASKSSASAAGGRERGLQKWQVRCFRSHFHVSFGANMDSLILEVMCKEWWGRDRLEKYLNKRRVTKKKEKGDAT
jgi:hypothetical protein